MLCSSATSSAGLTFAFSHRSDPVVWNHVEPKAPGELISSGASSLGWALGAAIGAKLAAEVHPEHKKDLVTVMVGDGSYIFGVPSASYWMARRYETVSLAFAYEA